MTPVTVVPATFTKVSLYKHNDPGETQLLCGIDTNSGTPIGTAYKLTRSNTCTLVGKTNALGKNDSLTGIVFADGTVRLVASQADTGASGSTCAARVYDFPGVFPKSTTATGGVDALLRSAIKSFVAAVRSAAEAFLASGI